MQPAPPSAKPPVPAAADQSADQSAGQSSGQSSGQNAVESDEWPDLAGRLVTTGDAGRAHRLPVRVYFEDTDFSGVVYHGSYIRFMERGRSDFVRLVGVGHTGLNDGEHGEPGVQQG